MTNRIVVLTKLFRFSLLLNLLILILDPLGATAQNARVPVVNRARIGGYAEDIAYVSSGKLKDHIVLLDGYELYSVAAQSKKNDSGAFTKVCDVRIPEFDQFPNGLTYLESEELFVMNQAPYPDQLFLFDQKCTFKGTRKIQYLNSSYRPSHLEGLAYIPSSSPTFPDHLVMVVWDSLNGPSRLEVVQRDGVVVSEIFRSDWPASFSSSSGSGIGDVAFLAPNRLLVSVFSDSAAIWTMDFNGNVLSGPTVSPEITSPGEGIVQLKSGQIVATNYPQNLVYFDQNLNRQAENDRHDIIGLNLNVPSGLGWNSDTNQFLVLHDPVQANAGIAAVSTSFDSAASIVDLTSFPNARQTTYLPNDNLIAALRLNPLNSRAILLFNNDGTVNSQVSLSPASLGQNFGLPASLAYLPTTDEFIVGFSGVAGPDLQAERRRLRVLSRSGTLVRTIDLTATGTGSIAGVDYFEDPGCSCGRLIILGSSGRAFVTDLDGNSRNSDGVLFREFNIRVKLGLITRTDITAITSGPLAGAFAVLDSNGGEVVIFRFD